MALIFATAITVPSNRDLLDAMDYAAKARRGAIPAMRLMRAANGHLPREVAGQWPAQPNHAVINADFAAGL